MFVIDVSDSIDELIKIIDTRTFSDPNEIDQLIRDFLINHEKSLRTQIEEKIDRIKTLKQANKKIEIRQEYNCVMEEIDKIILNRQLYFERLEKKYRYKGRYHYGNTQGKARNNKNCNNRKTKTH